MDHKYWQFDMDSLVLRPKAHLRMQWWVKYGDEVATSLLVHLVETCWANDLGFWPHFGGKTPEQYTFHAFSRGMSLLLGSEDVELLFRAGLAKIRLAFLEAANKELTRLEVLGYIIWALDYSVELDYDFEWDEDLHSSEASVDDMRASSFLMQLLADGDREAVYAMRGWLED